MNADDIQFPPHRMTVEELGAVMKREGIAWPLPTICDGVQWDEANDVLVIDGVRYARALFKTFGIAPHGSWLRIQERSDGVLTVFRVSDPHALQFDAMTASERPPTKDTTK